MSTPAPRPLDGITVVSLEHAIAAPFCTRQLADMGARVIKIERPGAGDFARGYDERVRGLSSHFVWTNRSKESLTLDLKREEAGGVMERLLESADVLVQNLAPGAAARLGLSFEALHAKHPRLIVCDISGYGTPGPYADRKAYDLLVQSEAGLLSVTGTPDGMAKAGIPVSDIAAGMYAYSSILGALLERGRTGRGAHLDVSMLEATVEWLGFPLYYAVDGGEPPPRAGAAHATICPYGPFTARDGKVVMTAVQNERIVGSVAIDGQDLGNNQAHLRWFILDDGCRGGGIGRQLLTQALAFCDQRGFASTELWTFQGLDAARKLYESLGFALVHEEAGQQWGSTVVEQQFSRSRGGRAD